MPSKSFKCKTLEDIRDCLSDAEILALNCMSPLAIQGCFKLEMCSSCGKKKFCLCFMGKTLIEEYKKKGVLV